MAEVGDNNTTGIIEVQSQASYLYSHISALFECALHFVVQKR